MPKFKQPLSQNPFHQWGVSIGGAANADPEDLVGFLANIVTGYMKDNFGMSVDASKVDITVGGLLSSKTFLALSFLSSGIRIGLAISLALAKPPRF